MAVGSSDLVRSIASEKYVQPALSAGKKRFSVAVRDLMNDLQGSGFPPGNYPQICTAIRTGKFLREQGLEIERVDGPPSGLSTTVVFHYKVAALPSVATSATVGSANPAPRIGNPEGQEDPRARARRLMEGLRGLLKEELAEYGGGEAFIRWIRSEDDSEPISGVNK
jgi:hypothetical protein